MSVVRIRIIEISLALISIIAFAYTLVQSWSGNRSRISPAIVAVRATDAVDGVVEGKIEVKNELGFNLDQFRITPSCTCAVADLPSRSLKMGESVKIPFKVNITGRDSDFSVIVAVEYCVREMWYGELLDIVVVF